MVDLTLHRPEGHLFIRSVNADGIKVVNDTYRHAIIMSAEEVLEWQGISGLEDLQEQDFQAIFDAQPDLVLLGTGSQQKFLSPTLLMSFYSRQIGIECMTTEAACRTFNVLMSEGRNAMAALIPLS